MKLVTYEYEYRISCGIVTDDGIIDIPSHCPEHRTRLHSIKQMLIQAPAAIERLAQILETAQERIDPGSLKLLAPIPRPGKVLALAGNYQRHLEETHWQDNTAGDLSRTTNPWPFLMPSTAVIGTRTTIPWPVYSEQLDYEIELAIFIGQSIHQVSPAVCLKSIAGYSIANDVSARSVTFKNGRSERSRDVFFDWMMGKWSDGFVPMGPYLVTADEIADPQNLNMELKVNGLTRQMSNTSQMIFNVGQIISFISHLMTLEPGDVILTGTPHGVAAADSNYLRSGDQIECTIDGLGTLTNTLGPKPGVFYEGFIY